MHAEEVFYDAEEVFIDVQSGAAAVGQQQQQQQQLQRQKHEQLLAGLIQRVRTPQQLQDMLQAMQYLSVLAACV